MRYSRSRLRSILLTLILLGIVSGLHAQQKDSVQNVFFRLVDSNLLTARDYAQSVESAYLTLNKVESEAQLNWSLLPSGNDESNRLLVTFQTILNAPSDGDARNLNLYMRLLEHFAKVNEDHQHTLQKAAEKLEGFRKKIYHIAADPILLQLLKDTIARSGLKPLQAKWSGTDSVIKAGLDTINSRSVLLTVRSIQIADMLKRIGIVLNQTKLAALQSHQPYLWNVPRRAVNQQELKKGIASETNNSKIILGYYVKQQIVQLFWLPLLLIFLLYRWMKNSYKKVKHWDLHGEFTAGYFPLIAGGPLKLAIVVILSIIPLFDIFAPLNYYLIMHFMVMIAVVVVFRQQHRTSWLTLWIGLTILLLLTSIARTMEAGFIQRCTWIAVNSCSIAAGCYCFFASRKSDQPARIVLVCSVVFILLNILSIFLNLFGRISIAQSVSTAGIFLITQAISLVLVKDIISEMMLLQLLKRRLKAGASGVFNRPQVIKSLRMPLNVLTVYLLIIVFSSNLNVYAPLVDLLNMLQGIPIHLGGVSLSLGSILLFAMIVWLAHYLQRHIGYFFGDTGSEEDEDENLQRSGLVITRLVIICIGYLLAVAASGLPVDRLTIILGALGVGIGMGLQNIVNNFVSGVILLFDRPLKIGDSVEIKGSVGKVKEIGVRSSTLITADGAEVIIPNGSILSDSIKNWTFSNNKKRIELNFILQTSEHKNKIIDLMSQAILSTDDVVTNQKPVILIGGVKDDELKVNTTFWCKNLVEAEKIRSDAMYNVYELLKENGIALK